MTEIQTGDIIDNGRRSVIVESVTLRDTEGKRVSIQVTGTVCSYDPFNPEVGAPITFIDNSRNGRFRIARGTHNIGDEITGRNLTTNQLETGTVIGINIPPHGSGDSFVIYKIRVNDDRITSIVI